MFVYQTHRPNHRPIVYPNSSTHHSWNFFSKVSSYLDIQIMVRRYLQRTQRVNIKVRSHYKRRGASRWLVALLFYDICTERSFPVHTTSSAAGQVKHISVLISWNIKCAGAWKQNKHVFSHALNFPPNFSAWSFRSMILLW